MTTIAKITKKRQRVLDALRKSAPIGISAAELGRKLGIQPSSAAEHLRKLRHIGLARPTADGGRNVTWLALGVDEERNKALLEARSVALQRKRAADEVEAFCNALPRRLFTSATDCPAPRIRGPISVFHLAAGQHPEERTST